MMQIENGKDPTNYDFWMATHVGLAKTPLDRKTSKFIEKLRQMISKYPEGLKSEEMRDLLLAQFLGPEKPGQMRKYGFGPTPTQVSSLKNQTKLIEEKVSILVDSIRKGLKEEIESDLRSIIEETVQDVIRSLTRTNSLAPESAGVSAPSTSRRDHRIPTSSNLHDEGGTQSHKSVPESSSIHHMPSTHTQCAHALSESSSMPHMPAHVQETQVQETQTQQLSANDVCKRKSLKRNVRSVWQR